MARRQRRRTLPIRQPTRRSPRLLLPGDGAPRQAGDYGALITAAEWLDVNYGALVRELFLGKLGGEGIVVIEPTATPFPDAATTAAITAFHVASRPKSVRLRRVKRLKDLNDLNGGRLVRRERLETERRWSRLTYNARECPDGFVELGELCRVHRGQVHGRQQGLDRRPQD